MAWLYQEPAEDPNTTTDLFISIPHRNDFAGRVVGSLLSLRFPPMRHTFALETGQPIDISRNIAVSKALQMKAKYLLFMDSDMIVFPDSLEQLLAVRRPIVSGIYRSRGPPHQIIANINDRPVTDEQAASNQLFEVDDCGMGFCLIDTRVLKNLAETLKEFRCFVNHKQQTGQEVSLYSAQDAAKNSYRCTICGNTVIARFFWSRQAMQNLNALSEDYYFCLQARKLGYKVLINNKCWLGHMNEFGEVYKDGPINPLLSAGLVR
jgi:glycosyltransferase involved in cell wall biosynthesis